MLLLLALRFLYLFYKVKKFLSVFFSSNEAKLSKKISLDIHQIQNEILILNQSF